MDNSPIDVEFEEIRPAPERPYANFGTWLMVGAAILAWLAPKVLI